MGVGGGGLGVGGWLLLLHVKHSVHLFLRALLMLNWNCLFTVSLPSLQTETVSYLSLSTVPGTQYLSILLHLLLTVQT